MDDAALLADYLRTGSQQQFATLVNRHVNWVYAVCRRHAGDDLAEDVTQAVFATLARKAPRLRPGTSISGWLFKTARYASATARKIERRRREHERRAAAMNPSHTPAQTDREWEEILPQLDDAIARLSESDRRAILLRFYQGLSHQDAAAAMGISAGAAQRRLSRAIEKLRVRLQHVSVVLLPGTFEQALENHLVAAAPPQVVSASISVAGAAPSAQATIIMKGALIMKRIHTLKLMGIVAGILAVTGTGVRLILPAHAESPATVAVQPAPTIQPAEDAARLYLQAGKALHDDASRNIVSPSASGGDFPGYPPFSTEWLRMEKQDYEAHRQVRELVHEAAMLKHATWPPFNPSDLNYLNQCRSVANEIGDAAVYEGVILKDQPAAFESAGELLHLSDLLKNEPGENLIRLLVAQGIAAVDAWRVMELVSGATITSDAGNTHDLPLATATQWIALLLDYPDAREERDQALKGEPAGAATNPISKRSMDHIVETINHVQSNRAMAAMSLAAHVYQYKHGKWPASLEELKTELPHVPVDPWGDGTQTLGYALIIGGLPDGSDRPLVYSRFHSKDGLFFRTDEPEYGDYNSDGSRLPMDQQKQGGQFRDVARWAPKEGSHPATTTQPLE